MFLFVCDLEVLTVRPWPTGAVEPWEGGGWKSCEGTDFRHLNRCLNEIKGKMTNSAIELFKCRVESLTILL